MIDPLLRKQIVASCCGFRFEEEAGLRREIIDACLKMNEAKINQGKSGNISARIDSSYFLLTPSGLEYDLMQPEDVVCCGLDGSSIGRLAPSSEWSMHRDIYKARPEIGAILHAHPLNSTAIACHGKGIPPFNYMVAVAGGFDIRCAPYATFGSKELGESAVKALEGRKACFLAHHGLVALGDTPLKALSLAVEVETLAEMYLHSKLIGEPPRLSDEEMARVLSAFSSYGQPRGGKQD